MSDAFANNSDAVANSSCLFVCFSGEGICWKELIVYSLLLTAYRFLFRTYCLPLTACSLPFTYLNSASKDKKYFSN